MKVYLFPTELEAESFREVAPECEVVISGVGTVATAATIAKLYREGSIGEGSVVVLAGVAGSYDATLGYGEVVEVVEECCVELPERFRATYRNAPRTTLRGVRSNTVHATATADGAHIENMEGAALFAMAEALNINVVEIRAISNRVGEGFAEWHLDDALRNLATTLKRLNFNEA